MTIPPFWLPEERMIHIKTDVGQGILITLKREQGHFRHESGAATQKRRNHVRFEVSVTGRMARFRAGMATCRVLKTFGEKWKRTKIIFFFRVRVSGLRQVF